MGKTLCRALGWISDGHTGERLELITTETQRIAEHNARMAAHFSELDASALDVAIEDFCESIGSALNSIDGTAVDATALSDTLSEIADLLVFEIKRLEVSP